MGGLGQLVSTGPHDAAHWNAVAAAMLAIQVYWDNRRYKHFPDYPKMTIHEAMGDEDVFFW